MWNMNDPEWPVDVLLVSPALCGHLPGSLCELRGTNRVSGSDADCDVSA